MPQLIANTLEKRAQSPRVHRKEIPDGLARAILRCLSKHPSERFKSYADLRRALEPYSSVAPTPATLGLRLAAGALDLCLLGLVSQIVFFLFIGDPFEVIDRMGQDVRSASAVMLPWILVVIAYYGLSEWRWGATPGKAICRLRVVGADQGHPPLMRALARAAIYSVVPMLPYGLMLLFRPDAMAITGGPTAYAQGFGYYVLLGLLFVTVRRRNRFASLHDLATGTRVVSREALARRSGLPVEVHPPAHVENAPQLGPYHVLETLGGCAEAEWMMGYDLRLLRRVLIRKVPAGTPPLADSLRHLSRPGRLRWLTGRREAAGHWDAFEGVAGCSLADLIKQPQPWAQVRFWLHDIAEELVAAEKDDTLPEVLELDRVWITTDGRAKLLDFPAPGSSASPSAATGMSMPLQSKETRATTFLNLMARSALGGRNHPATEQVSARLAIHARELLESLPRLNGAEAIKNALKPLMNRTAEVTRLRRTGIVAGCLAFPVMASLGAAFGISLMQDWQQKNPELMELSQILNTWRAKNMPFVPADKLPSDRLMGTYIASHYAGIITNEAAWSSVRSRIFIQPNAREFAETSIEQYGSPTAKELEEAEKSLEPIIKQFHVAEMPPRHFLSVFLLWVTLAIYVGFPAMIAALLFRGGLVLLAAGVTYVQHDGMKASRLRLMWRSLVAWSPAVGSVLLAMLAISIKSMSAVVLSLLVMVILASWSLWLPKRGLQDRLAGTWPVPR
jgi:uncharacterized RDD family membrane protein YckC